MSLELFISNSQDNFSRFRAPNGMNHDESHDMTKPWGTSEQHRQLFARAF
jgi:hypothetical protein